MGKQGDEALDKLKDAFSVVITGIILIVFAYLIIEELLKAVSLPFWIKYVVYGLLVFFVYLSRDKIIVLTKSILK